MQKKHPLSPTFKTFGVLRNLEQQNLGIKDYLMKGKYHFIYYMTVLY
jgi:hypothetical protein